jgi:hypothetical protein
MQTILIINAISTAVTGGVLLPLALRRVRAARTPAVRVLTVPRSGGRRVPRAHDR